MTNQDNIGSVLELIKLIPEGKVATYGQIAELVLLPRRARLVAHILKNHSDSTLPWHRVLRSDGKIAAHPSHQLQIDKLRKEGVVVKEGRVNLREFGWQLLVN